MPISLLDLEDLETDCLQFIKLLVSIFCQIQYQLEDHRKMGCGVALTYMENRKQINLQSFQIKITSAPLPTNQAVEKTDSIAKQNTEPKITVENVNDSKPKPEEVAITAPSKVNTMEKIRNEKPNKEIENLKEEQKQVVKIQKKQAQTKKQQPKASPTAIKQKETLKKEEKPKENKITDSKVVHKEQKINENPKPIIKEVKKQAPETAKIKIQAKEVAKNQTESKIFSKKQETIVDKIQHSKQAKQVSKETAKTTQIKVAAKPSVQAKNEKKQGSDEIKKIQNNLNAQKNIQKQITRPKTPQTKQIKPENAADNLASDNKEKTKINSQVQKQKQPPLQKNGLKSNEKAPPVQKPKIQQVASKTVKVQPNNTLAPNPNKDQKKNAKNMIPVEAVFFDQNILKSKQQPAIINQSQSDLSKSAQPQNTRPSSKQQIKNGSGESKNKNVIKLKQNVAQSVPEEKIHDNKDKSKIEKPAKEVEKQVPKKKEQDKAASLQQQKRVEQVKKKLMQEQKKKQAKNSTQLKQIYVVQ